MHIQNTPVAVPSYGIGYLNFVDKETELPVSYRNILSKKTKNTLFNPLICFKSRVKCNMFIKLPFSRIMTRVRKDLK
jgi:hypothetical protein